MTDMPDEFYMYCTKDVFDWEETIETDEPNLTGYKQKAKYIRSDIHEAELNKLRNALDVAEKAIQRAKIQLENIALICPIPDRFSGDYNSGMNQLGEALTAIKQARGEG